jgi:hypothetical protein
VWFDQEGGQSGTSERWKKNTRSPAQIASIYQTPLPPFHHRLPCLPKSPGWCLIPSLPPSLPSSRPARPSATSASTAPGSSCTRFYQPVESSLRPRHGRVSRLRSENHGTRAGQGCVGAEGGREGGREGEREHREKRLTVAPRLIRSRL